MQKHRNLIFMYIFGILVLGLLITTAFLGPGIVFGIQDGIRCREIVAVNQEKLDVTSFNTGYERNLYRRLERFAEGIQLGKEYYVTVQDMDQEEQEVTEWLKSDWYFDSEADQMLTYNLGLLPPEELYSYSLIRWKRCVIYDEDFSEGVNFILWYIELGEKDESLEKEETLVKLLVDGETGDLYAVRTNFDRLFQDMDDQAVLYWGSLVDVFNENVTDEFFWYMYFQLCEEYGGLDTEGRLNWLMENGLEYFIYLQTENTMRIEVSGDLAELERNQYEKEQRLIGNKQYNMENVTNFLDHLHWQIKSEGNELLFHFPYGEENQYHLDFNIRLDGKIRSFSKWGTRFLDMTFGFPGIYERIPGFTEN